MSDTRIPDHLAYTETHEWIQQDSDIITIGITDYAQSELGDIVFIELPDIGQTIEREAPFGTIEAVKTVEDLVAPVSGEVAEVNKTLEEHAERVNSDPYGAGWMIKIRVEDQNDLEALLTPSEYAEMITDK
jgi:glycine cleavage system H protein